MKYSVTRYGIRGDDDVGIGKLTMISDKCYVLMVQINLAVSRTDCPGYGLSLSRN